MKTLADLIKEAHMVVPTIKCKELAANKDDLMLIDVRESSELEEMGSIDGALNIPRGLIEMKLSPNNESMNINTPIVVFCGGGSRAALAGSTGSIFEISNIFGFLAIILAAVNIFGGFLVTQRMLQMYKKKKK